MKIFACHVLFGGGGNFEECIHALLVGGKKNPSVYKTELHPSELHPSALPSQKFQHSQ